MKNDQYLTTGQMIDALKEGEIAEAVNGFYQGTKLKMTDYNEIVYISNKEFFKLTTFTHRAKWKMYKVNPCIVITPPIERKRIKHD